MSPFLFYLVLCTLARFFYPKSIFDPARVLSGVVISDRFFAKFCYKNGDTEAGAIDTGVIETGMICSYDKKLPFWDKFLLKDFYLVSFTAAWAFFDFSENI